MVHRPFGQDGRPRYLKNSVTPASFFFRTRTGFGSFSFCRFLWNSSMASGLIR
jgi:hypothetical protein